MVYSIGNRYFLVILILAASLFGIKRFLCVSNTFIGTVSSTVLYPFLQLQKVVTNPFEKWRQQKEKRARLEELIESLGEEKENLCAQTIALQAQINFVEQTQELIQFQKRYTSYQKIIGQVIMRQLSPQGHFYLLDVGSRHGVELDMIAVYKNCMVGRVAELFPYYCKVVLITDQSCKVAAFCARTKTEGIYQGMNSNENAMLTHVSHLESLQKNDLVISSGHGLVFPRGFGLGKINYFEVDGADYKVTLESLVNLESLSYCYLMKKGH